VLAVQRAPYAVEARLMGFDGLPPARETLAELQACGEELCLCEEDGRPVGAVGLEDARGALVIARLFVAPEAMRRGVGRALVRRGARRRAAGADRDRRGQRPGARALHATRVPPHRRTRGRTRGRLRGAGPGVERWKPPGGGFQSWPRQDGQGYVP